MTGAKQTVLQLRRCYCSYADSHGLDRFSSPGDAFSSVLGQHKRRKYVRGNLVHNGMLSVCETALWNW